MLRVNLLPSFVIALRTTLKNIVWTIPKQTSININQQCWIVQHSNVDYAVINNDLQRSIYDNCSSWLTTCSCT